MSEDGNSNSDLSTQIANLIKNGFNQQPQNPKLSDNLLINLKLNSQNYALWTRMIRVAIGGKSKNLLKHLNTDPPDQTDPTYEQWEQDDLVVFSWLIQNIEPMLASNLTEFPTAKTLWEALVVTYSSGKDKLQTFNLHVKANEIKQNDLSLEGLWITFQGIWGEIERLDPNPMKCPEDIKTYTKIRSEQKLFQFLNALDRRFEPITREILRSDPPPTVEEAYSMIRKEESHQKILKANLKDEGVAVGLAAVDSAGAGFATKSRRATGGPPPPPKPDKSHLKCSHCGMARHTKEECFKLVGYPEWWGDGHKKGKQTGSNGGKAAAVVGNGETTAINDGGHGAAAAATQEGAEGCGPGNGDEGYLEAETPKPNLRNSNPLSAKIDSNPYFSQEFSNIAQIAPEVAQIQHKTFCVKNNKKGFFGIANMAQSYQQEKGNWIFDCGATDTMTYDPADFSCNYKPKKTYIQAANGGEMPVKGGGTVEISPDLKLPNCLYVPNLSQKLLSISHVTKELNCIVLMHPTFCVLQDIRTGAIIGRGTERGGLYYVDEMTSTGKTLLAQGTTEREAWLWHRRLGHPSVSYLNLLFPKLFISNKSMFCDTCVLAKSHRQTFKPNNTRVELPFSLVHSDVWGPAEVSGGQNFRYFLLFVDDCTRMTWVYFLQNKSEVFEKFTIFHAMVQTQFKTNIQALRSDNGGEFVNTRMKEFVEIKGMIHQTTCPKHPEQNGVAERKNRILLEMTRAMMLESHVPKTFWPEALATATYLLNRLPTKALRLKTPLQTLSSFVNPPSNLSLEPRVFGCSVFVHIPKSDRSKLDPCAEKCVFVGYGVNQKGYRCYSLTKHRIITTMNCDFLETEYFFSQPSGQGEKSSDALNWLSYLSPVVEATQTTQTSPPPNSNDQESPSPDPQVSHSDPSIHPENITANHDDQINQDSDNPSPESPSRNQGAEDHGPDQGTRQYVLPQRTNRGVPPRRYSPEKENPRSRYPMANICSGNLSKEAKAFSTTLYSEQAPGSVKEALESTKWRRAMKDEMEALEKNKTWEVCDLPPEKEPVGCKWVYSIKYRPDGTIDRYKARLVAKGYTQKYGIDYSETFSPVAKINTIRVLFSIAVNKGWPLQQFDVKNAFLHGDLKEEVYMEVPPGFRKGLKSQQVCRLKKALYGLKQSPRAWFGRFTSVMKRYGYTQSNSDHTLFIRKRGNLVTCLIIYVDDMIITGNDEEEMRKLKTNLSSEFEMKDLGRLKYFLGIEVLRSKQGLFIYQKKYILDLLAETKMVDCKPAETPMMVNHGLQINPDGEPVSIEGYQRLVGKLIYLSHTRPDIAYAVGVVSKFMHQPQVPHMNAVFRIIRYLKGTAGYGVIFQPNEHLETQAYTDADWAGDKGDRRSTSGYVTLVGGNLVTWRSKKQKVVALSSAEAEYRGIARGLKEVLWIRKLLTEIGFPPSTPSPIKCDNKAAIQISENPVQHDRTKHVEVDRHFIKEKLEAGIIELPFVRSEDQLADMLTKAVNERSFHSHLSKLNIGDPTTQLEGEC